MQPRVLVLAGLVILLPAASTVAAEGAPLERLADEIRAEATRRNFDPGGWPLPLAGHWNKRGGTGCSPAYQLGLLEKGHHIFPWFYHPPPQTDVTKENWLEYYEGPLKRMAALRLPITLVSTQWESLLYKDETYRNLPKDETPLLVTAEKIVRKVSPAGPVEPWRQCGRDWTASPALRQLQTWYPNPPRVLFLSNNEAARARPKDADLRGPGPEGKFRRHYAALIAGMREGLASETWRKTAVFIGYTNAPAPSHLGRWDGWTDYHRRYMVHETMNGAVGVWNGGSPSYYLHDWCAITDFRVWSPQIQSMNWIPFLERETYKADPDWWQEFSTWDGHSGRNSKREWYRKQGQTFTPERYGAMVQFGMWLVRPRAVREFRGHGTMAADGHPYFVPILEAVDRVYRHPTLKAFWRRSHLVANTAHPHPYQARIPKKYQDWPRWYLLDTNLDPKRPWGLATEIPVFALARVMGAKPARQWLVYAHSPVKDRDGVQVTIPDYREITVDVPVAGAFYLVTETDGRAQRVAVEKETL